MRKSATKAARYIAIENCIVESLIPTLLRRPAMPASSQSKQHLSIARNGGIWTVFFCRFRRATAFLNRSRPIGGRETDGIGKLMWFFGFNHPTYVLLSDDQG